MTAAKQILGDKFLKNFAPLGDLDAERFAKISKNCKVESYEAGTKLFNIGDRDNRTIYLTSGQISLTFRSGTERIITAETNQARNALVPEQPRQATAVAKTPVTVLIIDTDALDQVLHFNDSYEVNEIDLDEEDDGNDWMTKFLQSKAFLKLRAQNIQALMMRLEEIPVKAGQTIIKQGADDGYYYIVKRGKCRVTRKPNQKAPEIEVAVLGVGAGFGEEALIMREPRSATITMVENGLLMRLSRADFTRLLAEPLVQIVTYKDAVNNPKSVFVDVRAYDEYVRNGIRGCEHSPLAEMRAKIQSFDSHKQYVMVSNDGGRASAAAFLLCQQGLDAVVLDRGLLGVPDGVARGNGDADELDNIPVIDNVVDFQKTPQQDSYESVDNFDVYDDYDQLEAMEVGEEIIVVGEDDGDVVEEQVTELPASKANEQLINDPRVNAIFARAKERVTQEAKKAKVAEQARIKAEEGLEKIKREAEKARIEAEKARKQVEAASHQSAEVARLEAIKEAARLREVELGCKQAEVEEAIRQAEEEAKRAHASEAAYREAQEENARLKREMEVAIERTKQESRKSVEALKLFAEQEARHFEKMTKRRTREEEKIARDAEKVRVKAEKKLKLLKDKIGKNQSSIKVQVKILEEVKSETEREFAQQKLDILQEVQEQLEITAAQVSDNMERAANAQLERARAVAELEEKRLKAEHVRAEAARYACMAADSAYSEDQRISAKRNAERMAEKQLTLEESIREAEAEIARKQAIEDARRAAEDEIQQIRENAAREKALIEERALRIAEAARKEAEQQAEQLRSMELAAKQAEIENAEMKAEEEARRAKDAEEARLKAEFEIEKLRKDAEQARIELEKQLSADIKRSEIEHEVARVRAEELIKKQNEIDEISKATEQASLRAMAAEDAKAKAEQEIERLKAEIEQARAAGESSHSSSGKTKLAIDEEELLRKQQEILEIGKTLENEAMRIQAAESAQIEAQEEISRLRGEVESLRRQAQQQLNQDVERAAAGNASVRAQAEELSQKQHQIEEAIQQAQHQAQMAKEAIEAKVKAEAQAKQLKQQSEQALLQAREMVRKSKEQVREQFQKEIDQARAEEAALREKEIKEAIRKTKLESKRAEAAEKARLAAEREIERLKVQAEVRRIKAEKAIKENIKNANESADNYIIGSPIDRVTGNRPQIQRVIPSQSAGVDFFQHEPLTDLQAQDEMNLLFTNIEVREDRPSGAMEQIKAMSNKPKKTDDKEEEFDSSVSSSAWVSDQVMWEATLGIREDEKVEAAVQPVVNEKPLNVQRWGKDNIQAKQTQKAPSMQEIQEEEDDDVLFRGRDINPYAAKEAPIIPKIPGRQIKLWLRKAKILLWLSPFIIATGYYFSLSEENRVSLQLKISKSMSGIFSSSDISEDAKKLIEETEAKIAEDKKAEKSVSKKPKATGSKSTVAKKPAKRDTSNISATQNVTSKSQSFEGKDIPFSDAPVSANQGDPVLPPLPEPVVGTTQSSSQPTAQTSEPATTSSQTEEVITSVDGVAAGRVENNPNEKRSEKGVVGQTSLGELPPASFDASDPGIDVNAEQNSATFGK